MFIETSSVQLHSNLETAAIPMSPIICLSHRYLDILRLQSRQNDLKTLIFPQSWAFKSRNLKLQLIQLSCF